MLTPRDKEKIERYVDKTISELKQTIRAFSETGMPPKAVIEKAVECTVNRFTPESKMILSNVYSTLQKQAMAAPQFQNVEKKDAFYKLHILDALNAKFSFDVPAHIDYDESAEIAKKALTIGAAGAGGLGIIAGVAAHSIVPVCIGLILAAIMLLILKKTPATENNVSEAVDSYLAAVKDALMQWVGDIERFFDEQVAAIQ